jgi:hypothetical protein
MSVAPMSPSHFGSFVQEISRFRLRYGLSRWARAEMRRERAESLPEPTIHDALFEAVRWIKRAQDSSLTKDGGVARHYCLVTGWGPSYPETTGYIVPTFIREAHIFGDFELLERAERMLRWLIKIQLPTGAFQGGTVHDIPVVPVTFNTAQILLGLAAGIQEFGSAYKKPMFAAADWLVRTQDADGCWRRHNSPFAFSGDKTYDAHASWGLFEAARVEPSRGYAEAAMRNLNWAISHQNEDGWFANCCLSDPTNPLTHTLGYMLRGLVEGYFFTGDKGILSAALRTAHGALKSLREDGFLPGRVDDSWRASVSWSCLTGTEQLAICWFLLFGETNDVRFRDAALRANRFVRRTVRVDGPPETCGAVKGSYPVSGDYLRYRYPNWACKFFIDAQRLEQELCIRTEQNVPTKARTEDLRTVNQVPARGIHNELQQRRPSRV